MKIQLSATVRMRILVGKNYIEIKRVKSDQLLLDILVIFKVLEQILQLRLKGGFKIVQPKENS